jgi:acetyl esterase/lipase
VPVDYQVVPAMIHGFLTMGGRVDAANTAVSTIADALKQSWRTEGRPS